MDKPVDPFEERAAYLTKKHGCKVCGMIGCKCSEVEDTFSQALCKQCKADPCACESKPLPRTVGGVCAVCHRSQWMCVCTSHHSVRAITTDDAMHERKIENKRPYTDAYLVTLTNEAMNFYYNRDAEGLARWLRKALR